MKRTLVSLACALVVLVLVHAASGAESTDKPLKSPTGAMLRSLVFPGWGQLYNRSYIKAFAAAAVEGTLIIAASHQNDQMMRYKTGKVFAREKFYRNSRNELLWWLAGTILLSMGDAYTDAQLYGLDVSPDLTLGNGSIRVALSCNF
jgi:hypothetical protein